MKICIFRGTQLFLSNYNVKFFISHQNRLPKYILTLFAGSLVSSSSSIPATSTPPPAATVSVEVVQGLPHLTVPLPSRNEPCIFVLKPVTNTIGDLIMMLKTEDHGKKLDCQKNYIKSRMKKRTTTGLPGLLLHPQILAD